MSTAKHPTVKATTTCACGAIEVGINGPVLSMLLCSCLDCQKASGTGHSSVAIVAATALSVRGAPKSFNRPSDSGAIFTRHFCPDCGTPIYGRSSRAPDMRMVPIGLFAGNSDWFAPGQLIFARSHQEWDEIAEAMPRHEKYRVPGA